MTIAHAFFAQARRDPDRPAIEDGDRTLSYGRLASAVTGTARRLRDGGVEPGQMVALMLPDAAETLVAALALARLGAVMVSVNESQPLADRERAVSRLAPSWVISPDRTWSLGEATVLRVEDVCHLAGPDKDGDTLPNPEPDWPVVCRQSSGTTGVPKTVVWSHRQFLTWQARIGTHVAWAEGDRYFQAVRLSFSFSRDLCLSALCLGATVVMHRGTTADALADAIRESRATRLYVTAAHLKGLLQLDRSEMPLFPELKGLFCTSMAITGEERRRALDRLTPAFHETYGTNEVGDVTVARPADLAGRPDSIGKLVTGVEVLTLDADGRPLPAGEIGLIGFRADGFPVAYHNDPEATAKHFHDGWYFPGDLATVDADGYVIFKGRADDVINNAGAKFYPLEVEQVLNRHPEVDEAVVLAWPHAVYGEFAVAALVGHRVVPGDELRDFCRDHLASHKVPGAYFFLRALPKTGSGKVVKTRLAEMLQPEMDRFGF